MKISPHLICNVIVVTNGYIDEVDTFIFDSPPTSIEIKEVEQSFLYLLEKNLVEGLYEGQYAEDAESYCEDGYVEFMDGSVQIHWSQN